MVAARSPNITSGHHAAHTRSPDERKRAGAASTKTTPRTWAAKLRPDLAPQVVEDRRNGGRLLLPTPLLVGEVVASIPCGQAMTLGEVRRTLAERFEADSTCPLMTGMFATILAGVVCEDVAHRRRPRWPVWRLVRDDGTLHPKWPLDALYRATMLRQEGVRVTRRNGHWAALDTHQC